MDATDETIIELSKTKLVLLIVGSCAFIVAGGWMLSLDAATIRSERSFMFFFNDPMLVRGLGLAAIVCFGFSGMVGIKKLFDKKPGLVLNDSGIIDNASAVSAGFIPWSEVVGSGVYEIQKQKMLIIGVRDPRKYIDRGNALRRTLNKANYKMSGSPITISSAALKIDFSALVALFDQYEQKYVVTPRDADAAAPTFGQDTRSP